MNPDLSHFVGLAYQGNRPSCSHGEKGCRVLADAIVESWPVLDLSARRGARAFLDQCTINIEAARHLIDDLGA